MKISLSETEVLEILSQHLENKMSIDKDTLVFKPIITGTRKPRVSYEITVIEDKLFRSALS